jgi:hypothetical protein
VKIRKNNIWERGHFVEILDIILVESFEGMKGLDFEASLVVSRIGA